MSYSRRHGGAVRHASSAGEPRCHLLPGAGSARGGDGLTEPQQAGQQPGQVPGARATGERDAVLAGQQSQQRAVPLQHGAITPGK